MLHRTARNVFAGILLLTVSGEAVAKCRSFESKPDALGNMDLLLHKKLAKSSDGVAIKFGGQGQILSVIKFDDGEKELSDELLRNKLREMAGSIRYATELRGDKIVSGKALPAWSIGRRRFHAETVTATYKNYDVTAFEYVGLSHDTECFFMVRFTNAADADDTSSLERYKAYVEQAHMLLLKPEEFVEEEPEAAQETESESTETSEDRSD